MSRNLPHYDLDMVRQIAGERSGIILTSASDVCVNVADLPTEDLWLIVEALQPEDLINTTAHHNHGQVDTYCVTLGLHDFRLDLLIRESDDGPTLIVISLEPLPE